MTQCILQLVTKFSFCALPNKSLCLKGEKMYGHGEINSFHLWFYVWDDKKPVIIGKTMMFYENHDVFKNSDIKELPAIWKSNQKKCGWHHTEWMWAFNPRMKQHNQTVLLFLDNTTHHSCTELSNIQLVWFPLNTTSVNPRTKVLQNK
jgi:hypothetical protein